ncbi:hypothetical protein GCM10011409_27200 [Lentibacillus populi]|uniref:HTH cro/C1-type domain-containing protein n=1 Tax=Lentibacillus populi TaxID=1827502 RepID=A0A9W5TZ76_9BACI|nr:helix-turn-helix transcriptional regulator [Lentibacillus populi]GGB48210.1 hypothetical protein GCM10011409_27200 [Lentibacillus populi]
MKDFGLRLENLREKHGYSKVDVSLKLGFTANVYGSYEREDRRPTLETIIKLADLYGVSLDYLIRGREYEPHKIHQPEYKKMQELLNIITEKGIHKPHFLQVENWSVLDKEDIWEIDNHFEWVVHKAKFRK